MNRYIFVADEMGTPGMAFGTSNTFVFGGYVVHERAVSEAVEVWHRIKTETCGRVDVELKWKHFFVDAIDSIGSPVLKKDLLARRGLAAWALDCLFQDGVLEDRNPGKDFAFLWIYLFA